MVGVEGNIFRFWFCCLELCDLLYMNLFDIFFKILNRVLNLVISMEYGNLIFMDMFGRFGFIFFILFKVLGSFKFVDVI